MGLATTSKPVGRDVRIMGRFFYAPRSIPGVHIGEGGDIPVNRPYGRHT
ncbi:MAG: hypothetical protein ACI8QZ_001175 [Chlamydiales bacterium]|jgi:hypothetical protein